jgi:hypothetical protein
MTTTKIASEDTALSRSELSEKTRLASATKKTLATTIAQAEKILQELDNACEAYCRALGLDRNIPDSVISTALRYQSVQTLDQLGSLLQIANTASLQTLEKLEKFERKKA